jgi:hypothetical protein
MRTKIVAMAAIMLAGTGGLAAALGARTSAVKGDGLCKGPDSRVVVDLRKHVLALCGLLFSSGIELAVRFRSFAFGGPPDSASRRS